MKYFKKLHIVGVRSRYILMAMLLAVASVLGSMPFSNSAHAAIGSITQYTTPTADAFPEDITLGPDGNIWYTANGPTINNRVGKVTTSGSFTEYPNRTGGSKTLRAITKGSDGNVWYSERINSSGLNRIVSVTTSGTVVGQYSLSGSNTPTRMTLGPDGAVWYASSSKIGKITTSGAITEYGSSGVEDIINGPDGNLWFVTSSPGSTSGNTVGKITTSGVATYYSLSYNAQPQGIAIGSDGNLWFTQHALNKIGMITPAGVLTEYSIPTAGGAQGIAAGSDGALWFTREGVGKIGRVTTSGVFSEYSVPGASTVGIERIITGSDGAVWFLDWVHDKIGRVATELTNQTISFTSTAPTSATLDSPTYTPAALATSGLPVAITVDSSSTSVCSIDGSGNVSYLAAGTCTLNANQPGNADYNPAPQVQQSFTVAPVDADTSVVLDCPSATLVNDTVTCTITVSNDGSAAAENVSLNAVFSNSLTSGSLSGGGTLSGNSINWSTSSLAPSTSITLMFSATASTAGKVRLNAALIQTSPDPDASNNILKKTIVVS